ncbi:MAG: SDR family oxidoreductase, partial [Nocardioidaceae bacterium]
MKPEPGGDAGRAVRRVSTLILHRRLLCNATGLGGTELPRICCLGTSSRPSGPCTAKEVRNGTSRRPGRRRHGSESRSGEGIALVLGSEGATVYVTARSTREAPTVRETPHGVEDTAEEVTARGGNGIPVACDHTDDAQVEDLFARVRADQGRLDVLVCNAWGGYMPYAEHQGWFSMPFWQQSMERWDGMFTAGLRAHLLTARFALPMMVEADEGLVVLTTFTMGRRYLGNIFYDIAKNAVCRMVQGLADELRDKEVAVVALSPGWVRAERMTRLSERQEAQTESVEYIGRAVAALA